MLYFINVVTTGAHASLTHSQMGRLLKGILGSLKPKTVLSGISCQTGKEMRGIIHLLIASAPFCVIRLHILKHSCSGFFVLSACCLFPTVNEFSCVI